MASIGCSWSSSPSLIEEGDSQVEDKVLAKIRGLIQKAEHPSTPPEEAKACHEMADALMLKYTIDRATVDASKPSAERQKPAAVTLRLCEFSNPLETQFSMLSVAVANHTRCQVVLTSDWIRRTVNIRVFGFESELRYFEILYTTLLLHMSGIFFPKPDNGASLEDNLLRLRHLGLNWLQMAEVYGWRKTGRLIDGDKIEYINAQGDRKTNWQLGSFYKRTTHRAMRDRGMVITSIPAGTSRKHAGDDWRRSAATGYVTEIDVRLQAARGKREAGTDIILRSDQLAIEAMKNEEFDTLVPVVGEDYNLSTEAYDHGRQHAQSADIGGAARVAGRERTAIG